jgi:hypothetical protein
VREFTPLDHGFLLVVDQLEEYFTHRSAADDSKVPRAARSGDTPLPAAFLAVLPEPLRALSDRTFGLPSGRIQTSVEFLNVDGRVRTEEYNVVVLWYPWALLCAWEWLERQQTEAQAPRNSRVPLRRLLGRLVGELGTVAQQKARGTYTYEVAETLYALSFLSATPRPQPQRSPASE